MVLTASEYELSWSEQMRLFSYPILNTPPMKPILDIAGSRPSYPDKT